VTERPAGLSPATTARVLHAALFAGTAVAVVTLATLRSTAAIPPLAVSEGAVTLIRALVLTLAAVGTVGLRIMRQTLPPVPRAGAADGWWHANLGRAVTLWAFPDGVGIAGAVGYFLSADALTFALATGWALAMFVMYAPGKLTA
jgi:hypothetical protein